MYETTAHDHYALQRGIIGATTYADFVSPRIMVANTLTGMIDVKRVDGSSMVAPTAKNLLKDEVVEVGIHLYTTAGSGSYTVTAAGFSNNPNNIAIDGVYTKQPGLHATKAFWRTDSNGGMYLRWASTWKQWIFDDDLVDTTSVAYITGTAASTTPTTGTFINKWKYGSTSGKNTVNVPSMKIEQTVGGTKAARSSSIGDTKLLISFTTQTGGCKIQLAVGKPFHNSADVTIADGKSDVNVNMTCTSTTATGVVIKVMVATAINRYVIEQFAVRVCMGEFQLQYATTPCIITS